MIGMDYNMLMPGANVNRCASPVTREWACRTPEWHAFCLYRGQRRRDVYSILYIIGAIVVIIVVLRLLGLY